MENPSKNTKMSCSSVNMQKEHSPNEEKLDEFETFINKCVSLCKPPDLPVEQFKSKYPDILDLLLNFTSSLMERKYHKSLQLCKEVIDREPWNKLALKLFPLLLKKCNNDVKKRNRGSRDNDSSNSDISSGASSRSSSNNSRTSNSSSSSNSTSSSTSRNHSDDSNDSEIETESDNDIEEGVFKPSGQPVTDK